MTSNQDPFTPEIQQQTQTYCILYQCNFYKNEQCYPPESESIRRTYQSICLTSNLQRLNPKEKTSDQTTTERREFNKFLRDASKRIESWPAWKKGLLGKSEFK